MDEPSKPAPDTTTDIVTCHFCGKTQLTVKFIIAGPGVNICDECVYVCVAVLEEKGLKILQKVAPQEIDVSELGIRPRFRTLRFQIRQDHSFYLCPFEEPFNTIFNDHVCKAAAAAGFTIERADDVFGTEPIIDDIWQAINSSEVVIADVTGRNPNVMYEIGMAHTVGRPVIIMTQSMEDVPFDLKHYRCIVYEFTPRGCSALEEKIAGTLRFLKGRKAVG